MTFQEIIGQDFIKNHLLKSAVSGRIPHAQLFVGPEGSGTLPMAIAYAQLLLCGNSDLENSNGNASCNLKFESFSHPDLHFIFPNVTNDEVKTKPKSSDFQLQWREFLLENPYASLQDWYKKLEVKNKQGEIRVDDAKEILKQMSLKSYEGGYKVMIVWMAEKMNIEASNKLLKLLEEPPANSLFILVTENEEDILQTIRSRCQTIHFGALPEQLIAEALLKFDGMDATMANKLAHQAQGNYNKALHFMKHDDDEYPFEEWFVQWVRMAFKAKGNAAVIEEILAWSDAIAGIGRENQKQFLHFCIGMFRQALMQNYQAKELVYVEPHVDGFSLDKFAPFVTGNNILNIFEELSDAVYLIERNGNPKIIFSDLSIKLTRLIHSH